MTGEIGTDWLVIDSSVWLGYISADTSDHGVDFGLFFRDASRILVPTTVVFEVKKVLTKRQPSGRLAQDFLSVVRDMTIVDIDVPIASAAAEFALDYNLSIAQALIYAVAVLRKATLVTADPQLKPLSGVRSVPMV